MPMLKNPSEKYTPFKPINLPDRTWPSKALTKSPIWLATDLRDGNQSLVDPMDSDQKYEYFKTLVDIGYKEIEVSFPSASLTDFAFTRRLVESPNVIPDDVWIQVLSPCRKDLIKRTIESVKGAKKVIVHLYLATSPCFQEIVLNLDNQKTIDLAVECTQYVRSLTKDNPEELGTEWAYEFSPETFSDTNGDFVLQVCEAVKAAWKPSKDRRIIFNLPATVEMSTPNVYADQIEYFCRNISQRDHVIVSLHPHNDRGCAVAAAELAQMAGADRVEGTLFGNGERTGNVDLLTLALNLYTQGINPNVDFSNLTRIIDIVERCTKIPVHARAPYAGQLVVCAFSGSHQDAIKKGFQKRNENGPAPLNKPWRIPYLPLDPEDIGRTYEAIIRVNSQSGKGGVAWIIQRYLELDLPRSLQVDFSKLVQADADKLGREMLASEIVQLFDKVYHLHGGSRFNLVEFDINTSSKFADQDKNKDKMDSEELPLTFQKFAGRIELDGKIHDITGVGNGALSSLVNALKKLNIFIEVLDYKEHSIGKGTDVKAVSYINGAFSTGGMMYKSESVKMKYGNNQVDQNLVKNVWGVGIHEDVVRASLIAVLNACSAGLSS